MIPDPIAANVAFAKAIGLDPTHIMKDSVRITLDSHLGPIVEVAVYLTNAEGKRYMIDDEMITELRRFKLVPLADEVVSPPT